jgi:hypothetical protein
MSNEIDALIQRTVTEYLGRAYELVAFDDEGELWRIKVTERNPNGTPAPATYQCAVSRNARDVRCAFVDVDGARLVTMRWHRHSDWHGDVRAGDVLQWRYEGTTVA